MYITYIDQPTPATEDSAQAAAQEQQPESAEAAATQENPYAAETPQENAE